MTEKIGPGSRVTLHFELKLPTGEVIDSNFGGEPATFVMGDGNLLPGFETVLQGLSAGEEGEFFIEPAQGFGVRHPDNVQLVDRDTFGPDMELVEGLVVSFQNGAEGELPGVITGFEGDQVEVDFNHPLAGRTILFRVQIIEVEPPA